MAGSSDSTPLRSTEAQTMIDSGVFDPALYLLLNPDVQTAGADPAEHYVEHGWREGREPHPMFDIGWYAEQLPASERAQNPILHYVERGSERGVRPSVFFDPGWYRKRYSIEGEPFQHFLANGGKETDPSPLFDAVRYYRDYPDVAAAGMNPLVHYMMFGLDEGRPVYPVLGLHDSPKNYPDAWLLQIRQGPKKNDRVALLITHASTRKLKGHVEHYARSFVENNIDVCLIIAADKPDLYIPPSLAGLCRSIFVRENKGFDFAAWAHVMREEPSLRTSAAVYFTNDSIIGPIDKREFSTLLSRIDKSPHPLVGITDNQFYAWHLQSYFLAVKSPCLLSEAFVDFFNYVLNLERKNEVIRCYEISFTRRMELYGFTAEALFPMGGRAIFAGNRAVHQWQELADMGMPFIKGSLVYGEQKEAAGVQTRAYLGRRGFDLSLLPPV